MDKLKMLTIEDVANITNVHRDTVAKWINIGVINPIRTGKCYMFSQREILRFQDEYIGLDVSNEVNAKKSMEIVKKHKMSNDDYYNTASKEL